MTERATDAPTSLGRSPYWYGNAAKAAVLEMITQALPDGPVTVFDYGCGSGGDWPLVLSDSPSMRLLAWDPSLEARHAARVALEGRDASVVETLDEVGESSCDTVVSFSVLEHVVDRTAYLARAAEVLRPGGLFYLNYDDGHFRNVVDLHDGRGARASVKEELRNRLGRVPVLWRQERYYQRRVTWSEMERLIDVTGFELVDAWYHNLDALKDLAKTIPAARRDEFMNFWLGVERRLNDRFVSPMSIRGEQANLWLHMASRTLLLRRVA